MGRRRKVNNENEEDEYPLNSSIKSNNSKTTLSSHSRLSKFALFFAMFFVFSLFLYSKFKIKKFLTKEEIIERKEKHKSSKIFQQFEESNLLFQSEKNKDFYFNLLFIDYSSLILNERVYKQIGNNYKKLEEEKKEFHYYFLISNSIPMNSNEKRKEEKEGQELSLMNSYLSNSITTLTEYKIPFKHIYYEPFLFTSSTTEKILFSLLSIYKYTEALKFQLIVTRRRNNPPLHLRLYLPNIYRQLYYDFLRKIFSLNPTIDSLVEIQIESIETDEENNEISWIDSETKDIIQQKILLHRNEIEEMFTWNKFKTVNELERYILLEGKSVFKS